MSIGNVHYQSVGDFFNEKFYHIPNYQREYAWGRDEIDDFLNDLTECSRDPGRDHFFGQVVIHNAVKEGKKYIIDGQQRTITSFIFLKMLSILCYELLDINPKEHSLSKRIGKISSYIGDPDPDASEEDAIHLTLGEADNKFFVESIFKAKAPPSSKANKKSHDRMRNAFKLMYDFCKDRIKNLSTFEEKCKLTSVLYETLTKHFRIMYMEATEPEEAFVIFETLNARGKDLETADLLKNFIFSRVGSSQIEKAQENWNEMTNALDGIDATTFLRHYWNSSNDFTRRQALYRQMVLATTTKDKAFALLECLKKYAPIYHDLARPNQAGTNQAGKIPASVVVHLKNLQTLNAKTFYSVILAMYQCSRDYSTKELVKVVKTLENFVFRNATICGKTTNSMEVFMCQTAHVICDERPDADKICKMISQEIVTDDEFKASFLVWGKKTKDSVRYILRKLNGYYDKTHEIAVDNSDVHIEHIMPENNKIWKVDTEDHEKYLWRLGNLTLLSGVINTSISNKKFADKIHQYKDSKIALTQKTVLTDPAGKPRMKWTTNDIEARQKLFAEIALKIWPRQ